MTQLLRLLRLLRSVAILAATAKLLILNNKLLSVALLQRFPEVVPANFKLTAGSGFKLAASTLRNCCNSATAGDFNNIINNLSVAPQFATERNSCNRD